MKTKQQKETFDNLINIITRYWQSDSCESLSRTLLDFFTWSYAEKGDPAFYTDQEFSKYFKEYLKLDKNNFI